MAMEVILREDIDNLGVRGDVVKVAPGYARNFLLPKRLAVTATESNKKIVAQERESHLRKDAKLSADAADLAKLMSSVSVTIKAKAGENDHLFGSVTVKDVAEALEQQNFTIDRKKIVMADAIRQLGDHTVTLKLHKDVSIELPVHVVKED